MRVVAGEPHQLAAAEQIRARVPDVREEQIAAAADRRGQRRIHRCGRADAGSTLTSALSI